MSSDICVLFEIQNRCGSVIAKLDGACEYDLLVSRLHSFFVIQFFVFTILEGKKRKEKSERIFFSLFYLFYFFEGGLYVSSIGTGKWEYCKVFFHLFFFFFFSEDQKTEVIDSFGVGFFQETDVEIEKGRENVMFFDSGCILITGKGVDTQNS